jgi:hypothetical protein
MARICTEPVSYSNLSEAEINAIKGLYSNPDAFDYMKRQEGKFRDYLPRLIREYGGQFVIFEDNLILDSDVNESELMIRASKNKLQESRPLLFLKFVPLTLGIEYWLELLNQSISLFKSKNDELQRKNSNKLNRSICAAIFYLYTAFEASYVNQFHFTLWGLLILMPALTIWIGHIFYWSESAPRYNEAKTSFESLRNTITSCSQRQDHGFWQGEDKKRMSKALNNADKIYGKYICIYHPEMLKRVW